MDAGTRPIRTRERVRREGLSIFEFQMRSWFDDHMRDLAERGLVADRGYDDLPVGYDVPAPLRTSIDG